jgi:hypothetical protein
MSPRCEKAGERRLSGMGDPPLARVEAMMANRMLRTIGTFVNQHVMHDRALVSHDGQRTSHSSALTITIADTMPSASILN